MGLKIVPVASDSMGVRSMAVFVETSEGAVFIDPGAALAPRRYGLPPHETEYRLLDQFLDDIKKYLAEAEIVVITHYHRDHYLYRPGEEEVFRGKILLVKHPSENINYSQRVRAHVFLEKMGVRNIAKEVLYADGIIWNTGTLRLSFSPPLFHGECGSRLGKVLAVTLEEDSYRVMHASDIQGGICDESLRYVAGIKPDFLIISGPPTYIDPALGNHPNLKQLVARAKEGSVIILDHHFLRDRNYRDHLQLLRHIRGDVKVLTAAEYLGREVVQLEAYRDELWGHPRGRKDAYVGNEED